MFETAAGNITAENEDKWWKYVDTYYKKALKLEAQNLA